MVQTDGMVFGQGNNTQARLDSFFVRKDPPAGAKRPAPVQAKGKDAKKAKSTGKGAPGRPKGK